MKNSVEEKVKARAKTERIQERTTMWIARLTAQQGRLLFVTDEALVKKLGLKGAKGSHPTYRMRQAIRRLHQKGLVAYKKSPKGWSVHLTPAGKAHAEKLELLGQIDIQKPRVWDKKWRVVIFDIWERRRGMRDRLRYMLEKAGFKKVQNSVWVYPYDCEEFIAILRTEMKLGKGLLYLVVDGIEHDDVLYSYFDLA